MVFSNAEIIASGETLELSNPRTKRTSNSVIKTTWDCVYFGSYPQSDSTGETSEPIKWRVLSVNGNDAFLLAEQGLDHQLYNTKRDKVTWETCTLRSWLNNDFLNKAFTSNEQSAIKSTTVINDDNPDYGTEYGSSGGNNTNDKVFLLSIAEAINPEYGFPQYSASTSKKRLAENTAYAEAQGAYTALDGRYGATCPWWLRSPGRYYGDASYVDFDGHVSTIGCSVIENGQVVRPAMHIDLSSPYVTYAGTVSCEEAYEEILTLNDLWSFHNPSGHISLKKVTDLFGVLMGVAERKCDRGENGMCYGMCQSALAITQKNFPSLSTLGISSLRDLSEQQVRNKDIPNMHMTLFDYIEYAHIFQFSHAWQKKEEENLGDYDALYKKLVDYFYYKGEPPIITLVRKSDYGAHALLPLSMKKSDSDITIGLYDCNDPDNVYELKLTGTEDKVTGFTGTICGGTITDRDFLLSFTCPTNNFVSNISFAKYDSPGTFLLKLPSVVGNGPDIEELSGFLHYFIRTGGFLDNESVEPPVFWGDDFGHPISLDNVPSGESVELFTQDNDIEIIPGTDASVILTPESSDKTTIQIVGESSDVNDVNTVKILSGNEISAMTMTEVSIHGQSVITDIQGSDISIKGTDHIEINRIEGELNESCHVEGDTENILPETELDPSKSYTLDIQTGNLEADVETNTDPIIDDGKIAEPISSETIDPAKQYGTDGTALGKGASAIAADKAIKALRSDSDPKGTKFAPLMLKSTKQTKTSIKLNWKKAKDARKYVIYGNACGKNNKYKKLKTVRGKSTKITKIAKKKLKKAKSYKFIVVALDSDNNVVSTSKVIHVATKGKGNHTKITVSKKVKKNKISLKKGKTFKLGAKAVGQNVKKHVGVRYESSNPKIAKVSKTGKITAKKKGTCKIYVFAQNGVCKTIKITVK